METKFYRCPICGNVILMCVDSGVVPVCCGKKMEEMEVNTIDGKQESHLPVADITTEETVKVCKDPFYLSHLHRRYYTRVRVGETPHPMMESHHICFIYYETERGGQIRYLQPDKPVCECFYNADRPTAIYAYCNLHGLWKLKVNS